MNGQKQEEGLHTYRVKISYKDAIFEKWYHLRIVERSGADGPRGEDLLAPLEHLWSVV